MVAGMNVAPLSMLFVNFTVKKPLPLEPSIHAINTCVEIPFCNGGTLIEFAQANSDEDDISIGVCLEYSAGEKGKEEIGRAHV